MENPKVTVLMSVYNGENYLKESVESILNQTFENFEFIVIDDGSTDSTWETLNAYAAKDRRIMLIKNEQNIGLTRSLNKGLAKAKGNYVARQDADDVSLANRLRTQVNYLDIHPDVALVSCNVDYMDSTGKSIGKSNRCGEPTLVQWLMLFYNHIGGHSQVMFRLECVLKLAGYSEERRYSQDYELWLRLSQQGKLVIIPEVLLRYRYHENKLSYKASHEQTQYSLLDSQKQLHRLTKKIFNIIEVEDLRNFWLDEFSLIQNPYQINSNLWNTYHAFIRNGVNLPSKVLKLDRVIGKMISRQFYKWARALNVTKQKELKKHVLSCGYQWYPQGLYTYLQEELITEPFQALLTIAKKHIKSMLKKSRTLDNHLLF